MWPLRARYGRIPTPLDGVTGAVNNFFGLQGADKPLVEQTFLNRWEVGKEDEDALTWVAAIAEWMRPTPPGTVAPLGPTGKRFVLDTPELRFVVIRKILERIAHDRPVLIWFDDLHLASPNTFEMLARLRRDAPKLRILLLATARSEALETDLDAALRMESTRADWNGRVLEMKPLASEETEALLRATLLILSALAIALVCVVAIKPRVRFLSCGKSGDDVDEQQKPYRRLVNSAVPRTGSPNSD